MGAFAFSLAQRHDQAALSPQFARMALALARCPHANCLGFSALSLFCGGGGRNPGHLDFARLDGVELCAGLSSLAWDFPVDRLGTPERLAKLKTLVIC
ncbi:MAG: hypothetical protein HLUCCO16_08990 [Phormidium sp. OSCR]|nr:MAG: hypothetical protein HLUCCO16_08990 [Phormidium sp. OSCR]